ncbi:MAG TPA: hypothetical protein VNS32_01370, partial [Flavisolibacter sp.]|nr:hypothetical protein [Flavisolibacter sp.]
MKILILCIFTHTSIFCLGQDPQYYRVNKKNKLVELSPQDNGNITLYQLSGLFESAKKVIYIDSANHFKVTVPKWLKLKETNSLDYFGGVLPPINKIENAIVISSVKKENYKSFNEFKK